MSNETVCRAGQEKVAHLAAFRYPYKHIAHGFAA